MKLLLLAASPAIVIAPEVLCSGDIRVDAFMSFNAELGPEAHAVIYSN